MPGSHHQDTTRRQILWAGLGAITGTAVVGPARAGNDDPATGPAASQPALVKLAPEAVAYQPTPKDWQKCLFCTYFEAPATCAIVSGAVSAQGWCNRFALLHE
jgi:hypothetical protein